MAIYLPSSANVKRATTQATPAPPHSGRRITPNLSATSVLRGADAASGSLLITFLPSVTRRRLGQVLQRNQHHVPLRVACHANMRVPALGEQRGQHRLECVMLRRGLAAEVVADALLLFVTVV